MSWTGLPEIRTQLMRCWTRGDVLRAFVTPGTFPLRVTLKGPTSGEIGDRFEAVRAWADSVAALKQVRVVWEEVRNRVQGRQRLPAEIWVDDVQAACAILGKAREAQRWQELHAITRERLPALLGWVEARPLKALENVDGWERLLGIVGWMIERPRPGVYQRQVDVPGVDTKFLDANRGVLAELLDVVLPADAVDAQATGAANFARRYGFREPPVTIRFRVLDPALRTFGPAPSPDVTLDADSFAALNLAVRRVFVTENVTNFLAFPHVPEAIVLFGAGYGWEALSRAQWLAEREILYWGDLDTHGFRILDQLRSRFAHVTSFLMDRATLLAHEVHWGVEATPVAHDLERLTEEERAVFNDLRSNRYRDQLRLEQERIGFEWVERVLRGFGAS
ncbi:MAG: DUF2220 family protein [Burkholderiaceae bacterium]|jgi:hypothetical protein|nr:DUF2220 family protein [Burkholderiaceae bacterium]